MGVCVKKNQKVRMAPKEVQSQNVLDSVLDKPDSPVHSTGLLSVKVQENEIKVRVRYRKYVGKYLD